MLARFIEEITHAAPSTVGILVATRLTELLDLTGAMIITPHGRWAYTHPRTTHTTLVQATVTRLAKQLFADPSHSRDTFVESIAGRRIQFWPIPRDARVQAVLCVGPKRNGRSYTTQEEAALHIVVEHVTLLLTTLPHQQGSDVGIATTHEPERPMEQKHSHETFTPVALTPCERFVLDYLAAGLSTKEIAEQVQRSEKTVEKHIDSLYKKLGVHSRVQAVGAARQRRLLCDEP